MIGDKLVINEKHHKVAHIIVESILTEIQQTANRYAITIAGESGSGKSETAVALAEALARESVNSIIFQQDDYFVYPPKTNDDTRRRDIGWVGPQEVRLDLLDEHLEMALRGAESFTKPLVIYEEDQIAEETISLTNVNVIIAEGTYTTTLKNANCRAFIDLTYHATRASRLERSREEQDDFIEKVLEIEHKIISKHKAQADLIIDRNFNVTRVR